ncbi:hypothetical protein T02_1019 [Trichinella nativa]|uniref:Uncharacterized protein n=1 Tax=Trichinella nativa TaxID=6335 RepID=A0A0V1KRU1_9BILA|nr:hypothetical protein T02_1019 [Trichinella nativa]
MKDWICIADACDRCSCVMKSCSVIHAMNNVCNVGLFAYNECFNEVFLWLKNWCVHRVLNEILHKMVENVNAHHGQNGIDVKKLKVKRKSMELLVSQPARLKDAR